ncbi:DUF2784 domain-containing protein [Parapedobacter sp. 2B3]|uniref:DUF2784 domain-containing protein n=1 Tax=Parapedobacter sp. 2B3 TaxID=3342381 RepID=UPI0035B5CC78
MWLPILDSFYTLLHLLIIGFNLLGWIWPATRRWHLCGVLLTAASWLVLGIWYGIGYCPITDWQWEVKTRLGERNLPNSFVKYQVDKLAGADSDPGWIDAITAVSFAVAFLIALYLNFRRLPRRARQRGV